MEYLKPELIIIELPVTEIICTSPNPGTNEDIGYEEWDV